MLQIFFTSFDCSINYSQSIWEIFQGKNSAIFILHTINRGIFMIKSLRKQLNVQTLSVYSQYNHRLYPNAQLAYSVHHSTETALLKVKNDILLNMNKQHITLLVLLDLSAAFDTVQHNILLEALNTLGLGRVSKWFRSYLSGRSQRILVRGCPSKKFDLNCGIHQGSCLGPLLFTIYTSS